MRVSGGRRGREKRREVMRKHAVQKRKGTEKIQSVLLTDAREGTLTKGGKTSGPRERERLMRGADVECLRLKMLLGARMRPTATLPLL